MADELDPLLGPGVLLGQQQHADEDQQQPGPGQHQRGDAAQEQQPAHALEHDPLDGPAGEVAHASLVPDRAIPAGSTH